MAQKDKEAPHQPGPDGILRSPAEEYRLNQAVAAAFRGANGIAVLNYLKSISLYAVHGPEATNDQLRHREGMRFLYAIIEARIGSATKQAAVAKTETGNE